MDSLLLRIVLAPTLIAAASLAGRRWGPTISGWLIGLPLTSGPISFLLALSYGPVFAATAARGTLAGTISLDVFCLAYAWTARRGGWLLALTASMLAFAGATLLLQYVTLSLPLLIVGVLLGMVITIALMPRPERAATSAAAAVPSRWDLPSRMLIAALFVALLTGSAGLLGPRLTGLVAPFPVYATILAVFAHQQQGGEAAGGVLRGLLFGMFAFVIFFIVVSTLLAHAGIAATFSAAIVAALLSHGVTLWLLRRPRAAAPARP